jgi:AAA domain
MNDIYHLPESQQHPIVRGQYALNTPPIDEFIATICEWIDSRVTGGYIYGVSRLGKSRAVKFWVEARLAEKYHGLLPFFRLIHKRHERHSEIELLMELLEASRHKYAKSNSRKILLDRLVRLYATRARNAGSNHIVLMIDEAQDMRDPEYRTICNLQNELEDCGFQLTVISVGSHELTYQHEIFVQAGDIHLIARFMVRDAPFRGIRDATELRSVLEGYDSDSEWPEKSDISFTKHFFPRAFDGGFRIAGYSTELWNIFLEMGPQRPGFRLEVPMEHIAKTVEGIFRDFSDTHMIENDLSRGDLIMEVEKTAYRRHMKAVSYIPSSARGK